jgi:hypothetical protein
MSQQRDPSVAPLRPPLRGLTRRAFVGGLQLALIAAHPREVLDRPFDGGFMTRLWRLRRRRDGYVNEESVNWLYEGTALPISPTAGGLHGVLLAILWFTGPASRSRHA